MKIYLSAAYGRRKELGEYRSQLQKAGHTVVSRWIDGPNQYVPDFGRLGTKRERIAERAGDTPQARRIRRACATADVADLRQADTVVLFADAPGAYNWTGGKHTDFGIALGLSLAGEPKRLVVVGRRETFTHCLPEVHVFRHWRDAFRELVGRPALQRAEREGGGME